MKTSSDSQAAPVEGFRVVFCAGHSAVSGVVQSQHWSGAQRTGFKLWPWHKKPRLVSAGGDSGFEKLGRGQLVICFCVRVKGLSTRPQDVRLRLQLLLDPQCVGNETRPFNHSSVNGPVADDDITEDG